MSDWDQEIFERHAENARQMQAARMHTTQAGTCVGGPLAGKTLYHAEPTYRIGKDRLSKNRLIIGYQGETTRDVIVRLLHRRK